MKKIFAVALLSVALAACDSGSTDNNSNANVGTNSNSKPAPTIEQASPAPVVPTTAATPGLKAGDKVRVPINGASVAATVLSVDEKAGKVTVKIEGQSGEKTVSIADVTKQP